MKDEYGLNIGKHKFSCGYCGTLENHFNNCDFFGWNCIQYCGTLENHFNNCDFFGWNCIQKGIIEFGTGNQYNRKSLMKKEE